MVGRVSSKRLENLAKEGDSPVDLVQLRRCTSSCWHHPSKPPSSCYL